MERHHSPVDVVRDRMERARAAAEEWTGRSLRYLVASVVLFVVSRYVTGGWSVATALLCGLTGLGTIYSFEVAARARAEANFDLPSLFEPLPPTED